MRYPTHVRAGVIALLLCTAGYDQALALSAAHLRSVRYGNSGGNIAYSAAVDDDGSVYVTGAFEGNMTFGDAAVFSSGRFDMFLVKFNSAGIVEWADDMGGCDNDYGLSVATSKLTNEVFVTGTFRSACGYSNDIFVRKYNRDGTLLFSYSYGSTMADAGQSIAVDNSGNVIVTGYFTGSVNFGGGTLTSSGVGTNDIFVLKLAPGGTHIWSRRCGGTLNDIGREVAVDASNNIFVTGEFRDTADFSGQNLVSAGENDIFLAKYNADGAILWSDGFGDTGADVGYSVAIDQSGNATMTGSFAGTVSFGGVGLSSTGGTDVFLAKLGAAGVHQWSQRFGNVAGDAGYAVATHDGDIIVTGSFVGPSDFGGGNINGGGSSDVFLARFGDDGVHEWSLAAGGTSNDVGNSVALGAAGNPWLTGAFQLTANFGGADLTSAGLNDIILATYGARPAAPFITSISDIGNDQGGHVLIDFERSGFDDPLSSTPIWQYEAYRRNDPASAEALLELESMTNKTSLDAGWTKVAVVQAHGDPDYTLVAPTIGDSTVANGQHWSVFHIRATTVSSPSFYDSVPDSGYSLDNLAPGVPSNFVYNAGQLTWNPSTAGDFGHFTVYGSNTGSFAEAVVVDYTSEPAMRVDDSPYAFYHVTATDLSGNESNPATTSAVPTDVGGTPRTYVLSVSNYPNPFNPRTTVRYTLPTRGDLTVAVYDARGSLVTTLARGEKPAGAYTVEWDGRAEGGAPVSSGIYFARIEHDGAVRSKKMVLLK